MKRGRFITFEGGEGTGKTTQVRRLAALLESQGLAVLVTREPGGTPQGESLRNLLVNGDIGRWSSEAEALLMNAARDAHLRSVIRPELLKGVTVISDRFMDSTRVYQGFAGDCSIELIDALEREIVGLERPDLTLVFDLDPQIGLSRAKDRGEGIEDRYERKGLDFHYRLRAGFLKVASADPERCKIIDASQDEARVHASVCRAVLGVLDG